MCKTIHKISSICNFYETVRYILGKLAFCIKCFLIYPVTTSSPPACFQMFRCSGAGKDETVTHTDVRQEVPSWQCHVFISLRKTNWNSALTLTWQDRPLWNCVWSSKQQNKHVFHTGQDISGRQNLKGIHVRAWVCKPLVNEPPPLLSSFPLSLSECLPPLHLHPVWTMVLLDVSPWKDVPKLIQKATVLEEWMRCADSSSPPPCP